MSSTIKIQTRKFSAKTMPNLHRMGLQNNDVLVKRTTRSCKRPCHLFDLYIFSMTMAMFLLPTAAFTNEIISRVPARAVSIGIGSGSHMNIQSSINSPHRDAGYRLAKFRNARGRKNFGQRFQHTEATTVHLSAVTNDEFVDEDVEHVPLKEDEDFKRAVEEVKGAALNVTESSVKLTSTIVTKGPGIIGRLFMTIFSKQFRYEKFLLDRMIMVF